MMAGDRLTKVLLVLILVALLALLLRPLLDATPAAARPEGKVTHLVPLGSVSPGVSAVVLLDPQTGDVWLLSLHPATLKPILERRGRVEGFSAGAR